MDPQPEIAALEEADPARDPPELGKETTEAEDAVTKGREAKAPPHRKPRLTTPTRHPSDCPPQQY